MAEANYNRDDFMNMTIYELKLKAKEVAKVINRVQGAIVFGQLVMPLDPHVALRQKLARFIAIKEDIKLVIALKEESGEVEEEGYDDDHFREYVERKWPKLPKFKLSKVRNLLRRMQNLSGSYS